MHRKPFSGLHLLLLCSVCPLLFVEAAPRGSISLLDPVVVTAVRLESTVSETPAAVSVVDRATIQRASAQLSINEALRGVPGVFVLNPYNFAQDSRIAIRGFGARADFGIRGVRLVVDGIPATLPDGQAGVDAIDLGSAERIEVIRGPAAAIYGPASGGVLRIETEAAPSEPFLETRMTAGSYGLQKVQFKAGDGSGPLHLLVHGTHLELDGYRDNSRAENQSLNARIGYRVEGGAEWTGIVNGIDFPVQDDPGGLTLAEVREDPRQARDRNLLYEGGERVRQGKIGLAYRKPLADGQEFHVHGFALSRDFANKLPFRDGGQVTFERVFGGGGLSYQVDREALRLIAGLELGAQKDDRKNFDNLEGRRGPLDLDQEESVRSAGIYLTGDFAVTDHLRLSGAFRYDRIEFEVVDRFLADGDDTGSLSFEEFSPMVGIRWNPRPEWNLYANVATAFETPTTTELDNPGGGGFNTGLTSQSALSFEAGVKGRIMDHPWAPSVEVVLFRIEVEDALVPFELPGSPGRRFFRNAGRTEKDGLETAFVLRPLEGLVAEISYTYSRFRYASFVTPDGDFSGNALPGVPEHFGNLRLTYDHPSGWFAIWNTRGVGALYADDANTTRIGGYAFSDLRVGWNRTFGRWELEGFAGVNNVFAESYAANVRINAFGGRYYEPAPGRNAYGGFRVRFRW